MSRLTCDGAKGGGSFAHTGGTEEKGGRTGEEVLEEGLLDLLKADNGGLAGWKRGFLAIRRAVPLAYKDNPCRGRNAAARLSRLSRLLSCVSPIVPHLVFLSSTVASHSLFAGSAPHGGSLLFLPSFWESHHVAPRTEFSKYRRWHRSRCRKKSWLLYRDPRSKLQNPHLSLRLSPLCCPQC